MTLVTRVSRPVFRFSVASQFGVTAQEGSPEGLLALAGETEEKAVPTPKWPRIAYTVVLPSVA